MKTQVSLIWIPSLFLAWFWLPSCLAQNESDLSVTSPSATPGATQPRITASSPTIPLSDAIAEIVKLTQARIEDGVVLAFIKNSKAFNLSPDQIVELQDSGVPVQILAAMIQHDQEVTFVAESLTPASKPDPQPVPPTLSASPAGELAVTAKERTLPELERTVAVPQLAISLQPETPNLFVVDESKPSPPAKRSRFPVREPHPVELTAPIIMIQAAEITPNTLVIVGFPPTTR